jgi:hypothetical protein
MIRRDALPPGGEPSNYLINQLSIAVAVLSVIVTVATLILAGLGFIGLRAPGQGDRAFLPMVTAGSWAR